MRNRRDTTIDITAHLSPEDAERIVEAAKNGETASVTLNVPMLSDDAETLRLILEAPEDTDMVTLLEMTGLDFSRDLTDMSFAGVSWGANDMSGFDLSGCDLTGCDFSEATGLSEMKYEDAVIDNVKWPEGFIPYNGPSLRH